MATIWVDQGDEDIRDFGAANRAEPEIVEPLPVPVMPVRPRMRYTDQPVRPSSNFVAQLMAIERGYPQTREVQRVEPDQATAVYRSAKSSAVGGRTRRMS